MALLLVDGFEGYGTSVGSNYINRFLLRYPNSTTSAAVIRDGRYGGYAVDLYSTSYYAETPPWSGGNPTLVFGFAVRRVGSPIYDAFIAALYASTSSKIQVKHIVSSGELEIRVGTTTGTVIGATTGAAIGTDWVYVEVKVYFHDTVGTVDVYVDGVSRLSVSGADTLSGTSIPDRLRLYSNSTIYLDDLYVLDGSGTRNNDILGPQKVVAVFPTSDVLSEFTPSTGSDHYALVDEVAVGGTEEADWVEASSAGICDTFGYGDVSDLGPIAGVQLSTIARNEGGSALDMISRVVSGSTTSDDAGVECTSSRVDYLRVLEVDPDTTSPWSVSGINSAVFGVKAG
jgi:hypothetical protein